MCERRPELFAAVLGTLKRRAVFCPLFPAFGPEPARQRLELGDARVLVTTPDIYRRGSRPFRAELPSLRHVLLVADDGDAPAIPRHPRPPRAHGRGARHLGDPSDRGGGPRAAALHQWDDRPAQGRVPRACGSRRPPCDRASMVLDLHDDDIFWCTADPGWVTGTSYGIIAPLTAGVTSIVDRGPFDPGRWYDLLERERVSVWYTAPTALRMLDARRHRAPAGARPLRAALRAQRRRAAEPAGRDLGRRRRSDARCTTPGGRRRPAGSWSPTSLRSTSSPARWACRCPASRWQIARRDAEGQVVLGLDGEPELAVRRRGG